MCDSTEKILVNENSPIECMKSYAEVCLSEEIAVVTDSENTDPPRSKGRRKRRRRRRRRTGKQTDALSESDGAASDSTASSLSSPSASEQQPRKRPLRGGVAATTLPFPFDDDVPDWAASRYVALDCEMVGIGADGVESALARASVVDWRGISLYDAYVCVSAPVTDYRTHVSGITPDHILQSEGAVSFGECRDKILELLKDRVVVGHGLENDFKVLAIDHPKENVRDTAYYGGLMRGDPYCPGFFVPRKLRELAAEYAGIVIQAHGQEHCSVTDAAAAMAVYRHKRLEWENELH